MRKHELYEQALKQVQQLEKERAVAVATIEELCAEWNITLSNNEAQVINNIIINKGKVVAVDNTDNDRIQELEEKLAFKELLLNEFEENMDEKIKTIHQLQNEIKANNNSDSYNKLYSEYSALRNSYGELSEAYDILADDIATHNDTIEELKMQLDIKEEELEYYRGKEKEYEEDVEGMEMDIESLKLQMEGMKFAHENEVAELKATIRRLNAKIMFLEAEDEVFEEEEEIVADNEVGDAVGPQFIDIPDKYKDHPEIIETIKDFTDKWNNAQGNRLVGLTREQVQANYVIAANETLETIIAELKEADKYNISFTKLLNNKNKTVVAVVGRITLNGQEYPFKYGATHKLPCIYGCYDKALIEEAKEALYNAIHMIKDETTEKHVFEVVYAMDKGIVAWQTNEGVFKGYARAKSQRNGKRNSYAFVWDGTSAVPTACWCDHMYERQSNGQHMTTDDFRPMNKRWGAGIASLGQEIMAFCKTIDKRTQATKEITKEQPKDIISVTNEEVYKITKEAPQITKEVVNVTKEVEDLDI